MFNWFIRFLIIFRLSGKVECFDIATTKILARWFPYSYFSGFMLTFNPTLKPLQLNAEILKYEANQWVQRERARWMGRDRHDGQRHKIPNQNKKSLDFVLPEYQLPMKKKTKQQNPSTEDRVEQIHTLKLWDFDRKCSSMTWRTNFVSDRGDLKSGRQGLP